MNNNKVIICAGIGYDLKNDRWKNYKGYTQHMIPVKGVPIIHSLQTKLVNRGFKNIHVACNIENKDDYILNNLDVKINHIIPPKCVGLENNMKESSPIWFYRDFLDKTGSTFLLFGDVFFDDPTIDLLYKDDGKSFHVYGRSKSYSELYKVDNTKGEEKFAYVIPSSDIGKYIRCTNESVLLIKKAKKDNLKTKKGFYYDDYALDKITHRLLGGLDWLDETIDKNQWIECNDKTADFDFPLDYDFYLHK